MLKTAREKPGYIEDWQKAVVYTRKGMLSLNQTTSNTVNVPDQFESRAHAMQWARQAGWHEPDSTSMCTPDPSHPQRYADYVLYSPRRYFQHHTTAHDVYTCLQPWRECGPPLTDEIPLHQRLADFVTLTNRLSIHDHNNRFAYLGDMINCGLRGDAPNDSPSICIDSIDYASQWLLISLNKLQHNATMPWVQQKAQELYRLYYEQIARFGNVQSADWEQLDATIAENEHYFPEDHLEYLFTKYGLSGYSHAQQNALAHFYFQQPHFAPDESQWNVFIDRLKAFPLLSEYELDIAAISHECRTGIERILYYTQHAITCESSVTMWLNQVHTVLERTCIRSLKNKKMDERVVSGNVNLAKQPEMHLHQYPVLSGGSVMIGYE